jgi:hypothetical protein
VKAFLADEEEDDHIERLDRIVNLANTYASALELPKISSYEPTYERIPAIALSTHKQQHSQRDTHVESALSADSQTPALPADSFGEEELGDSDDEQDFAIKAFDYPSWWHCPFAKEGKCPYKGFGTQRGLAAHCKQVHKIESSIAMLVSRFQENPLEDGTAKIPCRWGCGKFFSSYHAANDHAKNTSQKCEMNEKNIYPRPCPWAKVSETECKVTPFHTSCAESAHCAQAHAGDIRGPYRCHLCGDHYADLYQLRSHVDRCLKYGKLDRTTSKRVKLGVSTTVPESTIFVARVSRPAAPRSWFRGYEFLQDGIGEYAEEKVKDFTKDFTCGNVGVVFHAHVAAQTRFVPTDKYNRAYQESHPMLRRTLNNAWKYTSAIETDLVSISKSGKATFVSIGLDGFACHAGNVAAFLKRNAPFTWIILETELTHGMLEKHFPHYQSGLYYEQRVQQLVLRYGYGWIPTAVVWQ